MCQYPLVSVVCPAFNAATTLRACVESVKNQSYQNIEVIIVDDGSTDGTIDIAENLAKEDLRIKIISQENSGSCVARNLGFSEATGQYVSAIDADDLWPSYKLEEQVRILNSNPGSIVIGGVRRFGMVNGEFQWYRETLPFPYDVKESYLRKLIQIDDDSMVLLNTFCAPREFILEDGWDPVIKTAHDWEVWLRLAKKYTFIPINNIYQFYRKTNFSTTQKNSIKAAVDSQIIIIKRHGPEILGLKSEIDKIISKRLIFLMQAALARKNTSDMKYCLKKVLSYKDNYFRKETYGLIIKMIFGGVNGK